MDIWIGGIAIASTDITAILEAIDASYAEHKFQLIPDSTASTKGDERVLIIEGSKGWTSIYPEVTARDCDLAAVVTGGLQCGAVVHRSVLYDAFALFAFAGGDLVDEFQSNPEFFMDFDEDSFGNEAEIQQRTKGQPEMFAGLSPRVNATQLAEIFTKCRREDFESLEEPEMSVSKALKSLRAATGIGTFEHSFDDLWYGAEDLGLKAHFRAYKDLQKIRGPFKKWRKRYRAAKSYWQAGSTQVADNFARIRDKLPASPFRRKPLDEVIAEEQSAAKDVKDNAGNDTGPDSATPSGDSPQDNADTPDSGQQQ